MKPTDLRSRRYDRIMLASLLPFHLLFMGIDACQTGEDQDGDGYTEAEGDCDDLDASIRPDALELCDALDNDCDGEIDEDGEGGTVCAVSDADGDGFTTAQGDCDDSNDGTWPGAPDSSGDGIDQDCGGADGQQPSVGLPTSAATSIQAALDAAQPGETVWIGPGRYQAAHLTFRGRALTLASTAGAEATVIDAQQQDSVMVFSSSEGPASVVRGLTLTGGQASLGGGIQISHASPTLEDLIVSGNLALGPSGYGSGGGIGVDSGQPTIRDCVVTGNTAIAGLICSYGCSILSGEGGGIYLRSSEATIIGSSLTANVAQGEGGGLKVAGGAPTIAGCRIASNTVELPDSTYGNGGGATIEGGAALVTGCDFEENYAAQLGGGLQLTNTTARVTSSRFARNSTAIRGSWLSGKGGGIYMNGGAPEVDNCLVSGNESDIGGGVSVDYLEGGILHNTTIEDNDVDFYAGGLDLLTSDVTVANVLITGNRAGETGGGIHIANNAPLVTATVVVGNHAPFGGGVYSTNSEPTLSGNVLAYNDSYNLYVYLGYPGMPVLVANDLYSSSGSRNANIPLSLGNLTVEPGFLRYDADGLPSDFHLASSSPLVDAGPADGADVDGTRQDPGIYGGSYGDRWDRDGDGVPDWFWPGTIEDAPAGFDPGDYDCDDLDPSTAQGNNCPTP